MVGTSYKEYEWLISDEGERKEKDKKKKGQTNSTGGADDLWVI